MAGIKITGYGCAHGDRTVTNEELARVVDSSDAWIRSRTGIESRYFADNRSNLDMACEAAEMALQRWGGDRGAVDLLLVCTFTPDLATPSVACGAAGRLGLSQKVMCLDINGACSGFVYGCTLAHAMLTAGDARCALVIGSEKISPLMDLTERGSAILFGDGAGAVVLEADGTKEFASYSDCIPESETLFCERFDPAIMMKGQDVYRFAVNAVPESIYGVLRRAGRRVEDVDWFICHQANLRILRSVAGKLDVGMEHFYVNIQRYGNTSAASVAICLSEMLEKGLLKPGQRVVITGFGAGLTCGSILLTV
ncbi:beta-ketoacyl-ACP synthase 3 [Hornefia butyriciproducens]|uniref:beta-ketoacyl-ACP synthase 3 n=1 Tax=Hornefia butyriciproducens TaxID=2652293 RepID=UPI0023F4850F|nr:beta-ketoacyl-ACP synthase 3 [Hornefia butyriciproducens]MDD6298491.1 beta-ketoacyl-ACP synthase 3 [Hornefia butyriciproducens]